MTDSIVPVTKFAVDSPTIPTPLTQFMVVRMNTFTQRPFLDSLCVGDSQGEALAEAHLNDTMINDCRWVEENPVVGAVAVEIRVLDYAAA